MFQNQIKSKIKNRLAGLLTVTTLIISTSTILSAQAVNPKLAPTPEVTARYKQLLESRRSFESAHQSANKNMQRAMNVLEKLLDQRTENQKKQDAMGISQESFSEIIKSLQTQRVNLLIDLVGLQARYDVIVEQKDKADKKRAAAQELVKGRLQALLKLQVENLGKLKKTKASRQMISDLELKVLDTEIKIMALSKDSEGEPQSELKSQLNDVSLTLVEKRARLTEVNNLLPKYTAMRKILNDLSQLETEIKKTNSDVLSKRGHVQSLQGQIDDFQKSIDRLDAMYDFDK